MALKIFGVARSRAFRNLWMAKELGLDYEHVKVDFAKGETRTPAHLALNPNGHVPVIDDDGVVLWESMAINLYLAKKYGAGTLYPTLLEDEARAWQWSFWGMTEVERPVLTALFNRAILSEDKRDAAAGDAAEKQLAEPLRVLDGALGRSANLLGADFTVADLNVASILAWARPAQIDMSAFPKPPSGSRTAPSARLHVPPGNCSGSRGGYAAIFGRSIKKDAFSRPWAQARAKTIM
jgi:glutathione S-transferase